MLKISVVIPTFRRQDLLKKCLKQMAVQDLDPALFEVIVADDENSPKTKQLLDAFKEHYPLHQWVYVNTGPVHGPAAARNCGWKKAQADLIAFTDDDCLPVKKWLTKSIASMDPQLGAIWGQVVVPLPKNPTDYQLNMLGLMNGEFLTANCVCRKEVLERIGGFDERFFKAWREDSDLYFTLLERNIKVKFVSEAVVFHPARRGRFAISIAMQKNNMFEALLYNKHKELYRTNIHLPILKLFYGIIGSLLIALIAGIAHQKHMAFACVCLWAVLTGIFIYKRLKNSSHDLIHIWEMIVTSVAIPPVAIYWRIVGLWRFKNYANRS